MEQNPLRNHSKPDLQTALTQHKNAVAMVIAAAIMAFAVSAFCLLWFENYLLFAVVQVCVFLATGMLHVRRMDEDFQELAWVEKSKYTGIVAGVIFLLFCALSLFIQSIPFIILLTAPVAFALPFLVSEMWRLHMAFSFREAKSWELTNELSVNYPDVYLTGIPVRFKILSAETNKVICNVPFRALGRMTLGENLCDLLLKEMKKGSNPVELIGPDKKPYKWIFFKRNILGWETALDPTVPLHQNKVIEKDVIFVQRVPVSTAFISEEKKKLNVAI